MYDLAVALGMREGAFRSELRARVFDAGPRPVVLDVGSGTGTLAIALAREGARVTGVEPDAAALERTRGKLGAEAVSWHVGRADALPMADASIDRVVLSLVLHHLPDEEKRVALREARRVLRPEGRLLIADWTTPGDRLMTFAFRGLQAIDGTDTTELLARGGLPVLLRESGFASSEEHLRLRTALGRLAITSARPA